MRPFIAKITGIENNAADNDIDHDRSPDVPDGHSQFCKNQGRNRESEECHRHAGKHGKERNTDTDFSITNYREVDNRLFEYKRIGRMTEDILNKIIDGQLTKYYSELVLLDQPYWKDDSKTVGEFLKDKGAKLVSFTRYEVGEGMEKRNDNLAEEVAKQMAGK